MIVPTGSDLFSKPSSYHILSLTALLMVPIVKSLRPRLATFSIFQSCKFVKWKWKFEKTTATTLFKLIIRIIQNLTTDFKTIVPSGKSFICRYPVVFLPFTVI